MKRYINLLIKLITISLILLICTYISVDVKSEEINLNTTIQVEVIGEINNPGIYELKYGSNFNDLLQIIKLKENADISSYSLQSILYNNQLINIPSIKQIKLISINNASISELITLPGIGEKTAKSIIDYRENISSFLSLEDLKLVKGIGESKYEKIKEYICL